MGLVRLNACARLAIVLAAGGAFAPHLLALDYDPRVIPGLSRLIGYLDFKRLPDSSNGCSDRLLGEKFEADEGEAVARLEEAELTIRALGGQGGGAVYLFAEDHGRKTVLKEYFTAHTLDQDEAALAALDRELGRDGPIAVPRFQRRDSLILEMAYVPGRTLADVLHDKLLPEQDINRLKSLWSRFSAGYNPPPGIRTFLKTDNVKVDARTLRLMIVDPN